MKGHGAVRIHIPHFVPVPHDEKLLVVDGPVRRHIIGHQQLVAPLGAFQLLSHGNSNLLVDRDRPHLSTLALDGDGVLLESPRCCGGVNAEALMDTEASIPGQIQGENEVIAVIRQGFVQHSVELRHAPSAVILPEATAFQSDTELVVGGQYVLVIHLVVEKQVAAKSVLMVLADLPVSCR